MSGDEWSKRQVETQASRAQKGGFERQEPPSHQATHSTSSSPLLPQPSPRRATALQVPRSTASARAARPGEGASPAEMVPLLLGQTPVDR